TVGNTDFGVATVESPAPDRNAAMPAIATDPAFPTAPPITNTCPKLPLLAAAARGPIKEAISTALIKLSFSLVIIARGGDPIGATNTSPAVNSENTCAGRGAVKVTTALARAMETPDCTGVSASAPDGISTATTCDELAFTLAIASA